MDQSEYLEGREELIEGFRHLPFFQSIDAEYFKQLLKISTLRRFQQGETIFNENNFDLWTYIIILGDISIYKGQAVIANLAEPGDMFGELCLIDDEPRSATVKANCDTICLAIDVAKLKALPDDKRNAFYAVFYRICSEILANRLRATNMAAAKQQLGVFPSTKH